MANKLGDLFFGIKFDTKGFESSAKKVAEELKAMAKIRMDALAKEMKELGKAGKDVDLKHYQELSKEFKHVAKEANAAAKEIARMEREEAQSRKKSEKQDKSSGKGFFSSLKEGFAFQTGKYLFEKAKDNIRDAWEGTIGEAFSGREIEGQLAQSLKNAGVKDVKGAMEPLKAAADEVRRSLHIDDDDTKKAYAQLIRGNMSVQQALGATTLVADLARAKHMDMGAAAEIVSKAFNGETRALKAVGVYVAETGNKAKDGQLAMDALRKTFGGAAAAAAANDSPFFVMQQTLGELMQSLGDQLIPIAMPALRMLSDWFQGFEAGTAKKALDGFMGSFKSAFSTVQFWTVTTFEFFKALPGKLAEGFMSGKLAESVFSYLGGLVVVGSKMLLGGLRLIGLTIWDAVTTGIPLVVTMLTKFLIDGLKSALGPKISEWIGLGDASKALGNATEGGIIEIKKKTDQNMALLKQDMKAAMADVPDLMAVTKDLWGDTLGGKDAAAKAQASLGPSVLDSAAKAAENSEKTAAAKAAALYSNQATYTDENGNQRSLALNTQTGVSDRAKTLGGRKDDKKADSEAEKAFGKVHVGRQAPINLHFHPGVHAASMSAT